MIRAQRICLTFARLSAQSYVGYAAIAFVISRCPFDVRRGSI